MCTHSILEKDKTSSEKSINLDRLDRAQTLATQLDALLSVTTGEPGEGFRVLSNLLQSNFMWACSDMAKMLIDVLDEMELSRHD